MKEQKISILQIAATYIGTVIGAGFASGQELLQFFVRYGFLGFMGLLITSFLFIYFGYKIMACGRLLNATSHKIIMTYACGHFFGKFLDGIITFFLFGALTAMIAGTGALFQQLFHISALWGQLLMTILTILTVLGGLKGIVRAISVIMPFLLLSTFTICIVYLVGKNASSFTIVTPSTATPWWWSAILYVSYNLILSVAILGPIGAKAKTTKALKIGAILGGIGLGLCALFISLTILATLPEGAKLEIPMIFAAAKISPFAQWIYVVVLIAEIYTTAVGSLYGFVARLCSRKKTIPPLYIWIVSFISLLASQLGFTNLVKYYYPLIGYCGIVLLICLITVKTHTTGNFHVITAPAKMK